MVSLGHLASSARRRRGGPWAAAPRAAAWPVSAPGLHDGSMTSSTVPQPSDRALYVAIVLNAVEDECAVMTSAGPRVVRYALPFPRPRAGRVLPGHLVAITTETNGSNVILWRWFDAVVVDRTEIGVTVWEANDGIVIAQPRDPHTAYRRGSRAYLSSGLPGGEWWLAGPAVTHAEDADVELEEIRRFYSRHGLWERLAAEERHIVERGAGQAAGMAADRQLPAPTPCGSAGDFPS